MKKENRIMNKELIAKAKAAKSAEELLELAKANNVEMTAEEAKTYFAQLSAKGAVADDELDAVAGGGCGYGKNITKTCPQCGAAIPYKSGVSECPTCGTALPSSSINF